MNEAVIFTMKKFAYTLQAPKSTVEGAGSLFDTTPINKLLV